ncbi:MAG: type VI secretion system baseplate subunit TssG [Syntrophobacteraceae bacterium]
MKSLKQKIEKEIRRFDFISLLRILFKMGYTQDQISFRSYHNLGSQPSLLEEIEFRDGPHPQVVVYVNLGLMSVQTPLPSYFFHELDQGAIDPESFGDFLAFFDRRLLEDFVLAVYPEINPEVYPDWELAKKQYAGMLNLRSCSTLHWLFSHVFPELAVHVEKAVLGRKMETNDIVLGKSSLNGDSVFGKRTNAPVHGLRIALTCAEEQTGTGVPWPREVRNRMESMIFPLLKTVGIDMEVFLIISSQKSWAKLQPESFLGYDRIKGGNVQERRIPIYLGHIVE